MRDVEHQHHSHPSRCCADEAAADVLERLKRNPPKRLGHQAPHGGWSGENQEAFAARMSAWEAAVQREEVRAVEERARR